MSPTAATTKMTAEEFGAWWCQPENVGRRFDLIDGAPTASPLPARNPARWPIYHVIHRYAAERGGWSMSVLDDGLVVKRAPDTVLTPDLMLFADPPLRDDFPPRVTTQIPTLVVEIYPADLRYSQVVRRGNAYLRSAGVPLLWIVVPEDSEVWVCRLRSNIEVYSADDELPGTEFLPDFRCRVADLFALPGQHPLAP